MVVIDEPRTEKYVLEDMYEAVVNGRTDMSLVEENNEVFKKVLLALRQNSFSGRKMCFFREKGVKTFLGGKMLKISGTIDLTET